MKVLGLAAAALLMTIGASGSTLSETCTGVASPLGSAVIAPTTLVCSDFATASLNGGTATGLQIEAVDSFDGGNPFNASNVIDVEYSSIIAAITVLQSGSNGCLPGLGTSTCTDTLTGVSNGGGNLYDFGAQITTGLAAYIGAGTFNIASVTSAIDASSGSSPITGTGDVTTQFFAILTYQTSIPEPASMVLLGGGLLAAGLIGRKKLIRK